MNDDKFIVSKYTRAEALADGMLVDVSDQAQVVGFKVPVALSRAAWSKCVEWTSADSRRQGHQDQSGRLWDVLVVCYRSAVANESDRLTFSLSCIPRDGAARHISVELKACIGPGDAREPVVTIMLPDED